MEDTKDAVFIQESNISLTDEKPTESIRLASNTTCSRAGRVPYFWYERPDLSGTGCHFLHRAVLSILE